jgi:hypothetical protein
VFYLLIRLARFGCLLALALVLGTPAAGSEQKINEQVSAVPAANVPGSAAPGQAGASTGEPSQGETAVKPVSNALPRPPLSFSPSRAEIAAMIERLAGIHRLDLDLVHALIRAESAYDPTAVSRAGAIGLMQVMPATASDYGVRSVDALFDPKTNLDTGMRHFKRLLDKYGSIGHAVMAYNAGEGALERGGGFVVYPETQRYTHAVISAYLRKKGVEPYTAQARKAVGMDVTPAMAAASSGSKAGASLDVAASKTPERAPVTRLTSRLSPGLSRRSESADSPPAAHRGTSGLLSQNRLRFAGDAR